MTSWLCGKDMPTKIRGGEQNRKKTLISVVKGKKMGLKIFLFGAKRCANGLVWRKAIFASRIWSVP